MAQMQGSHCAAVKRVIKRWPPWPSFIIMILDIPLIKFGSATDALVAAFVNIVLAMMTLCHT